MATPTGDSYDHPRRARQTPVSPSLPRIDQWIVGVLTLAFFAISLTWAVLTPGFRGPDEPQHVNSVLRIAQGGGWPAPGTTHIEDTVNNAAIEAGMVIDDCNVSLLCLTKVPRGDAGWSESGFLDRVPVDVDERSTLDELAEQAENNPALDQMSQHPPLYYGIVATVVRLTGALDWQWDSLLLLMRTVTAALGAPLIYLVHRSTLVLTNSRRTALVAAAIPLGIPQLTHIAGVVSNDPLTISLAGLVTLLTVRLLQGDSRWRTLTALGIALGLASLTKGTALPFALVAGLALLFRSDRNSRFIRRLVQAVATGSIAIAAGMWWWLANLVNHGTLQPAGSPPFNPSWGDPDPTLPKLFAALWKNITRSFWGEFGWLEVPISPTLSFGLTIIALALCIPCAFQRRVSRLSLAILAVAPATMLAILIYGSWDNYSTTGLFAGMQGRYFFPTIPILIMLTAVGARTLTPNRLARTSFSVLTVAGAAGLAVYGMWTGYLGFYVLPGYPPASGIGSWLTWTIAANSTIVTVVLATAISSATSLVLVLTELVRAHGLSAPDSKDVSATPAKHQREG